MEITKLIQLLGLANAQFAVTKTNSFVFGKGDSHVNDLIVWQSRALKNVVLVAYKGRVSFIDSVDKVAGLKLQLMGWLSCQ